MRADIQHPKIYPPANCCIYCGSCDDLSEEHIIARALNGAMKLPNASCRLCRDATSSFERTCARTMFGPFRLRHGMRTGHKKERPSGIYIQNNTGANESKEQAYEFVPAANLPDLLFFLKFTHTANILIGAPDIDTSRVEPWILAGRGAFVGKNGWVVGKFDAFSFARMLAKIGHSFAKAEMGAKTFAPIALDFMFGRTKNLSYIVGGSADIDAPSSSLHWLRLRDHFDYSTKRRFLVSHIRLFACLGAPTYHVVVGETAWDSPTLGGDP